MNILIVEDNATNRKLLRLNLKSLGHEIVEAADGVEALRHLEAVPFDVVISDILMPNMDGFRLCLELRQHPRLRLIPIILCSNTYPTLGDAELARGCGANAFLEKPASMELLKETIRKVTTGPAPASATRPTTEDMGILKKYSERLISRIEEQNLQLFRQKAALEASDEKFRQLAENISEVFWIRSLDFSEMLYISPTYEQVWGRPVREVYDNPQSWMDSIHLEDQERIRNAILRAPDQSIPVELEYRIVRPDGVIRWIRLRKYPVRDKAGIVYRIGGIAEDITERRALESQFRQAQKMEAVGRLAGGIAHDFNNLLTVINGYCHMAQAKLDAQDPMYGNFQEIRKAGERAADLTRQLLTFSRKQVLQPRVIDLNTTLSGMEDLLRRLIGEHVTFITSLARDLASVRVDPGQIEQVVMNLAVNGRDAMPRGGTLKIETSNVDLDRDYALRHPEVTTGTYVMIGVTDSGTGMTDDVQAHLFEPFFTTKDQGKGTGLGLASAHGIVRQSGGHIEVRSEVGLGTTVRIYLPTVTLPLEPLRKESQERAPLGGGESILLVEDESSVRSLAKLVLGNFGYRVIEARHGEEAIEKAGSSPDLPQLLLTDIVMPGMSGLDLYQHLSALKPGLRVVFMSGYTDLALGEQYILSSGAFYLGKPFSPKDLLAKVREALDAPRRE